MPRYLKAISLLATLALSGCGAINSSSFKDMSAAYRDVLETYSNDNILLNVVRAAHRMPVSFLEMPSVVGTGNVSSSAGLNTAIYGSNPASLGGFFSAYNQPFTSSYAPTLSLSVNNGFTFTQSSLDNAQFMTSFLADIKPETIAALTNNMVAPKEVLYSLVIESIETRDSNNKVIGKFVNNPNLSEYKTGFQRMLYGLMEAGLSTETTMEKMTLSAPMDGEALNRQIGMLGALLSQPGVMIETTKTGGRTMYQVVRAMPSTKFCMNKQMTAAVLGHIFSDHAYCQSLGLKTLNVTTPQNNPPEKITLAVNLRSTRTIFDYLGTIVNLQVGPNPRIIEVQTTESPSTIGAKSDKILNKPVLVVEKNNRSAASISSVTYQGDTYSIPSYSDSWSRDVFVTLAQLLTLNKVPGSIPASPSVLVK